jgi:flagellar protein FliJ
MKKFRYRLEPILKIKSHTEKQRQKDHAHALQNVYKQLDVLMEIDGERNRAFDFNRDRAVGKLSVQTLQATSRYLGKLKMDALKGKEVLSGLEKEAERKRVALVEASRDKKVYEKLKEKKKTQFLVENESLENKTLDEIATQSFCFRHHK